MTPKPQFFKTQAAFRQWLQKNHRSAKELHVGYYKKHTGRPSITWPESVEEALCFGWIDGIRRRIDDDAYTIRFTPRRPGSVWSAVNVRLVAKLESAGKMREAGKDVFNTRTAANKEGYSYEQPKADFDDASVRKFRRSKKAWMFFNDQPRGYRTKVTAWIMAAKKSETKDRRLIQLITACSKNERLF